MTSEQRDAASRIITNPWWIVVAVVLSGGMYAGRLAGEVQEVKREVLPLSGVGDEVRQIRRELDSLRIEQRHIGQTVNEIRHLLGRQQ